ncbi:MAG: single-stranded DNA-binding protein [Sphaerochaeta sp.]|jgi:single-strand DNA-binding protein|nr:single-stranded DNA-binding protein [Sphaerochaeta sp.]MCH3920866.1 single-stranded DNA-binding protein [Sphaerochaeta sp.]MCI2046060.1 single-stranded DNA-binding protein [Sphaerochaeta sp.]MCI2076548.1 single-stranded DNA-binding protein [Sphaerochaeta sp.]MCI2096719.1 single-stranded DNA-binding protein [Sphaerochaeta sp.]
MATDLNVVALVGRLTRDAEIRYTQGGSGICHFSIAVNRRKRTGDNQWEDEANFFDCSLFGKTAISMQPYLLKGKQVSILGELRQGKWESDGQQRSKVEIVVNSLQLLGSNPNASSSYGQNSAPSAPKSAPKSTPETAAAPQTAEEEPASGGPDQFDDDTIPF